MINGTILYANESAARMHDATLDYLIGKKFVDLFHPIDHDALSRRIRVISSGGERPKKVFIARLLPREIHLWSRAA